MKREKLVIKKERKKKQYQERDRLRMKDWVELEIGKQSKEI